MLVKGILLFFAFVLFFRSDQSFNQDLGRHLKTGEIILQNFSVPKINLFSYTNPDFPFINTHWLFGVTMFLLSQVTGLQMLLFFKILIILLAIWICLKIIPKENSALLLPIGFIFFHLLRERTDLRPEIFSFLFTALTYYILETFLRANRGNLLFILPLIQILWINTHIYFFVGLVLQLIFLIYLGYQKIRFNLEFSKLKLLGLIFLISIISSLLNPNGINGLLYPLKVTGNYGYTIVENQNIFFLEKLGFSNSNFVFVKISAGIIIFILLLNLLRKKFDLKNTLIAFFGLTLALMHVRSLPYLVFLSLPAIMQDISLRKNRFVFTLSLIASLLLLVESFFYLNGSYYEQKNANAKSSLIFEEDGKEALDFVIKNKLPGPIFNNFDIGSYITYRAYPEYKVFVDGRPEAYPAGFFQSTYIPIQSDFAKFKEGEKIFQFKTIIFSHTDQTPWGQNFLQMIIKDPEWKIVFIDDYMIVLTRVDANDNLSQIDLIKLKPSDYQFNYYLSYLRLGIFLHSAGNQDTATKFFEKVAELSPENPLITGKKSSFFW